MELTKEQLDQIAAVMSGQSIKPNGRMQRGTKKTTSSGVVVQAVAANEAIQSPIRESKAALEAPSDARKVVYGDKTIAIHRVRKQFTDGAIADYVQFTGFRARFGDFSLTMNQARMLADPDVMTAFSEYMEQLP